MKKLIILLVFILLISCRQESKLPAIIKQVGTEDHYYYYKLESVSGSCCEIYIYTDSLRYKVGDTIK